MAAAEKERSSSMDDACDLGLGRGLQPGAFNTEDDAIDWHNASQFVLINDGGEQVDRERQIEGKSQVCGTSKWRWLRKSGDYRNKSDSLDNICGNLTNTLPLTAKCEDSTRLDSTECYKMIDANILEDKVEQTREEIRNLKSNIELCEMQLQAKTRAMTILQGHTKMVENKEIQNDTKSKFKNQSLLDEVNRLQFELDHRQSYMITSQQTWAERFDRICVENKALMATLEARSAEMRQLHADKMGVIRERDELLALLDIHERYKFQYLHSEENENNTFNISELAVLGACRCHIEGCEPCGCAFGAASLKKSMANLSEKLDEQHVKQKESAIMTDAYRIAFEEQLARNRGLIRKIAQLSNAPGTNRTDKAKAAIIWLMKQINEGDIGIKKKLFTVKWFCCRPCVSVEFFFLIHSFKTHQHEEERSSSTKSPLTEIERCELPCDGLFVDVPEDTGHYDLNDKTEQDLVDILVDMVCDKSEALTHQRLTARLLASRNKDLESRLSRYEEMNHQVKNE